MTSDGAPAELDRSLEAEVARAREGDRNALEGVVRAVQRDVYGVALRFFWHPQDAEDATQEILVRVITGLGGFHGESSFRTWVYRVACNTLLALGRKRMEERSRSFAEFAEDLSSGLSDDPPDQEYGAEQDLLLEEVKIGCTLAMLLCQDRNHRLAYVLGEILELDHQEAAGVLEISPAAFRKRLSRARADITSFMIARCGLVNPANACRCRRRVATAVDLRRVDPANLLFASSLEQARRFPEVLGKIRQLEETRRAAALYRSHPRPQSARDLASWLKRRLDEKEARQPESVADRPGQPGNRPRRRR
jgi:RNA polymerase sigma factor (sigma-70 family)